MSIVAKATQKTTIASAKAEQSMPKVNINLILKQAKRQEKL